jgi:hypothetical protein
MAARLAQLRTKAAQAADFASKQGGAYYKEAMEKNKQYVVQPPHRREVPGALQAALLHAPREVMPFDRFSVQSFVYMWRGTINLIPQYMISSLLSVV